MVSSFVFACREYLVDYLLDVIVLCVFRFKICFVKKKTVLFISPIILLVPDVN